jgi:hypothetical protein
MCPYYPPPSIHREIILTMTTEVIEGRASLQVAQKVNIIYTNNNKSMNQ